MRTVIARFVLEARRRGILKVATAYLIVTWLVLEIGHTLFLVFDLPHGALQFVFVLLALGFPLMLVAVWHGWLGASVPLTEASPANAHSSHHEGPWLAVVFGAVALFAVAVAIAVRFFGMGGSGSGHVAHSQASAPGDVTTMSATTTATAVTPPAFNPPAHSIAVLPFVNMSGDPQQEYFSDGLAEELLDSLVRISELKVAARTSAFAFKGRNTPVGDIARQLNVGAILEGSVRKSGERVRIRVQLVNATNGYQLWSQTYDRELKDIFVVQADIAASVVGQLQATLLGNLASPTHTPSPEAYAAYLQGRHFSARADRNKAIAYYEQALALDEHYARAMVGLAGSTFGSFTGTRPDTEVAKVRELVDRAIALDPQLAAAYVVRSRIERAYDFDWAAAEASLKQARELEPGNVEVLTEAGFIAIALGRFDESLALQRQVVERDPLMSNAYLGLAFTQLALGKPRAAEATYRKALDLQPESNTLKYGMALALIAAKEPEKALAEAELISTPYFRLAIEAMAYHALRRNAESDAALREMTEKYAGEGPYRIARTHAYRGEVDQAVLWLEQAHRHHDGGIGFLLADPLLATLHHEPRYRAFLRKLNLPTEVVRPSTEGH
jgi:TolB-like protein/Tfp pilus assembly protein PilF